MGRREKERREEEERYLSSAHNYNRKLPNRDARIRKYYRSKRLSRNPQASHRRATPPHLRVHPAILNRDIKLVAVNV